MIKVTEMTFGNDEMIVRDIRGYDKWIIMGKFNLNENFSGL